MQLNKHADHAFAIRRIDAEGLVIGDGKFQAPFAVSARGVETEFQGQILPSLEHFSAEFVQCVLSSSPEVVLFATGKQLRFPSAAIRAAFLRRGVGLEAMDTRAAVYTYNVLLQEQREVLLLVLA